MVEHTMSYEKKRVMMRKLIREIFDENVRVGRTGDIILTKKTKGRFLFWTYNNTKRIGGYSTDYNNTNKIRFNDVEYYEEFNELAERYEKVCGKTQLIDNSKEIKK